MVVCCYGKEEETQKETILGENMHGVLMGSVAAKLHFSDFRQPGDVDILYPGPCVHKPRFEMHDCRRTSGLQKLYDQSGLVLSPTQLLSLKLSHILWNINWEKTLSDIRFFQLKNVGYDSQLVKELRDGWREIHGDRP